jgi:glucokinase
VRSEGAQHVALVADIGATNVRLALLDRGNLCRTQVTASADFPSIGAAITSYLATLKADKRRRVSNAAIAVAGPVISDWISLTNQDWSFSIEQLRHDLGFKRLTVVNDFTSVALAVPHLNDDDRMQVGQGSAISSAPIGVIGPGSGLGVGALIPTSTGWVPLSGEGGHVTLAAATPEESKIIERLRETFGHVSAERALSGAGLSNLHQALVGVRGLSTASSTAEQITDVSMWERDPILREAVDLFCSLLGTVAGNLALTIGAHGGVYIAGGIVPKIKTHLMQTAFRERFEGKGRLQAYVRQIPTYVITHPFPAFVGLSKLLNRGPQRESVFGVLETF